MNVSFEGIGHMSVTFHTDIRQAGQVCKMGDQAKVTACADGDAFCGVVESVRGDAAGVQIHGFAQVRYSGTAPKVGYAVLAANGQGGVKTHTAGRTCLVVRVDEGAKTAVIEL